MDMLYRRQMDGAALNGRRVLAILPLSRKEKTKYVFDILEMAKARWNWHIDVICQNIDKRPFDDLVAPSGKHYSPPHLLKVAEWEHDPNATAAVDRCIHEAEILTKLPFGRVVLAGGHSIGRAYNAPFRAQPRYRIVQKTFADNLEPFRIVRRLFRFADETLAAANPAFVIAFDWATPLHFSMWLAATRRGIPCVAIRNSKINHDHAYWTTDRLLLNTAAIEQAETRCQSRSPPSNAAVAFIRDFREKPRTITYIATKWHHKTQRRFLRWHLIQIRRVVREALNAFRGQDRALREPATGLFARYYRSLFMTWYHQRFMRTVEDQTLAGMKYVYFPMHKEAELAQTFQATLWHDQRNTIRVLASLLPVGYRLLVREHRFNFGQRPTRFYRQMAAIPNLLMIDPFDSQFKYLRNADLVVTENGSSGWEGLLLNRRVITLADTFYDGAGQGVKVTNVHDLNAAILDALTKPPVADQDVHDAALGHMVDAEMATTFHMSEEGTQRALDLLDMTVSPAL